MKLEFSHKNKHISLAHATLGMLIEADILEEETEQTESNFEWWVVDRLNTEDMHACMEDTREFIRSRVHIGIAEMA